MRMLENGTPLRQVRVFVSSPGDVSSEREITKRVFQRLHGEFAAYLDVKPYFWEHEPMWGTQDFQSSIAPPEEFDLFLCFLWGRLGTRLNPKVHCRADGSPYNSGTEFEFENALQAYMATGSKPQMLIYLRREEPPIPWEPEDEREKRYAQFQSLRDFIRRWRHDPECGEYILHASNSYRTLEQFEIHLENALQDFLRTCLPANLGPQPVRTWAEGSPFRGLRYFDYEHAPVFCGRTRAVDEVFSALKARFQQGCPFILVGGSSGVGKSSLVRAGVLPHLLRPHPDLRAGMWRYAELRPADMRQEGEDLCDLLLRALTLERPQPAHNPARPHLTLPSALPELLADSSAARLTSLMKKAPQKLARRILRTLRAIQLPAPPTVPPAPVRLCLFLDQLEDVFTQSWVTPAQRDCFFAAVTHLVATRQVFVIATMRADFLDRCEAHQELMRLKAGQGTYHLEPPTGLEQERMVRLPARAAGLEFESPSPGAPEQDKGLDALLLEELRLHGKHTADAAMLPLLGYTLERLYACAPPNAQGLKTVLRLEDYAAIGGLSGAIASTAAAAFAALSPQGANAFSPVMRLLVTVSTHAIPVPREASADALWKIPGAREFVDVFERERLLFAERRVEAAGHTLRKDPRVYRLGHDTLLQHWDKLNNFVRNERTFLQVRTRVETAAGLWFEHCTQDGGAHTELLLAKGVLLSEAEALLATNADSLEEPAITFIRKSVANSEKTVRDLRRKNTTLRVLLCTTVLAGAVALYMNNRAQISLADAEKLIEFMSFDLRDKLSTIGRQDIFEPVLQQVDAYWQRREADGLHSPRNAALPLMQHLNRGDQLLNQNLAAAQTRYEQALKLAAALALQSPENPRRQYMVVNAHERLARLCLRQEDTPQAARHLETALTILRRLQTTAPDNPEFLHGLASVLNQLGSLWLNRGNSRIARAYIDEDLQIAERLSRMEPEKLRTLRAHASSLQSLAQLEAAENNLRAALRLSEQARGIRETLLQNNPNSLGLKGELGDCLARLANFRLASGDSAGALELFRTNLAIAREMVTCAPGDPRWQYNLSSSLLSWANVLVQTDTAQGSGAMVEALTLYRQSADILKTLVGKDSANRQWRASLLTTLNRFGKLHVRMGNTGMAVSVFTEGLSYVPVPPENVPYWSADIGRRAMLFRLRAQTYLSAGKLPEALDDYRDAADLLYVLENTASGAVRFQRDLAEMLYTTFLLERNLKKPVQESAQKALQCLRPLNRKEPDEPRWKQWIVDIERTLTPTGN